MNDRKQQDVACYPMTPASSDTLAANQRANGLKYLKVVVSGAAISPCASDMFDRADMAVVDVYSQLAAYLDTMTFR